MEIKLNGKLGGVTTVSPNKYALLSKHNWHINTKGYVTGTVNGKKVLLHRFIMNAPKGSTVC